MTFLGFGYGGAHGTLESTTTKVKLQTKSFKLEGAEGPFGRRQLECPIANPRRQYKANAPEDKSTAPLEVEGTTTRATPEKQLSS